MKFARIVFAALVVCGLSAYAADASAIAVQITKSNAVLTFPDFEGTKLSLKPYSGATSIQNAKIISSVVAPSDARMHYVVVQLSGPTTSGKGSGQCGAGEEVNLVWLKIYSPAVVDAQSILTDSCAYTLESTPITDPKNFTVSYDSPKDNVHYMVHYDEKKPMAGFTITTTPMPK